MVEKMEQLAKKAIAWGENWSVSDLEYNAEYNRITVWVCRPGLLQSILRCGHTGVHGDQVLIG